MVAQAAAWIFGRRAPVKTRTLIIAAILTGAAILTAGVVQIVLGRAGH